jgi:hypothetical protein
MVGATVRALFIESHAPLISEAFPTVLLVIVVGKAGFEPAISRSRTGRDTRLRYFPKQHFDIPGSLFNPGDHSFPNRVTFP